jgi:hypothetical protein
MAVIPEVPPTRRYLRKENHELCEPSFEKMIWAGMEINQ